MRIKYSIIVGCIILFATTVLAVVPSGTTVVQDAGKLNGIVVRKPTSGQDNTVPTYINSSSAYKPRAIVLSSDSRLSDARTPLIKTVTGGTYQPVAATIYVGNQSPGVINPQDIWLDTSLANDVVDGGTW